MSQQYRRIPLDEFLRQATTILDGVAARGETVLIEHKGKFFSVGAYQAYRRRAPAKPQPPNMQDSLWGYARSSALEAGVNGASTARVAEESSEVARQHTSRNGSEPSGEPIE
jgi:hypothetical protein